MQKCSLFAWLEAGLIGLDARLRNIEAQTLAMLVSLPPSVTSAELIDIASASCSRVAPVQPGGWITSQE